MKIKILTVLLSTTIILSLLTGCTKSNNNDNNTNLTTTTTSSSEDISETTEISSEEITEEVLEEENDLVWLKNNYTKFRADESVISDQNIKILVDNPTIDTILDKYMSWHIVDSSCNYCELSELLDHEISYDSKKMITLKETKEFAESFDEGPKSDVFIIFENPSDETITVKEAIENKWYIISYSNYADKYGNDPTSMRVNLGCADEYDKDILEKYIISKYGLPNFFGLDLNYNYNTIEDFIANEKDYSPYDLGWIGNEYGIFITIRMDGKSTYDGFEYMTIDDIRIIPVEMLQYTQEFSTTPYDINSTVYNSNLIKK